MSRPRVVLAGIIGRYPIGGVTWCALHYIAGLQQLGYDVFYLEDTGECPFDPVANGIATDPSYAVRYIRKSLTLVGLEDQWAYIDYRGRYHGKTKPQVIDVCRNASAMLNLSGGCWFLRPEYDHLRKIFIDTDPGFTQQTIAERGPGSSLHDFFAAQDALFTFALNIGAPTCTIPTTPFRWRPTIQPLVLEFWPVTPPRSDAPYTAIFSWRVDRISVGQGKSKEILRLAELPSRVRQRMLLAVGGPAPRELLTRSGWEITDGVTATINPEVYRAFIQDSRGELGFAKSLYVETRSGWFSDRTQCYLASGRPAVVRDTAFGDVLPCGEGLLVFTGTEDLVRGLESIESDYGRHSRRARELAEEHFAAEKVLRSLLEQAGL